MAEAAPVKKDKAQFGQKSGNKGLPAPVLKSAAPTHGGITVKMTGKESKDFQGIVRILGRDIEGHTKLKRAFIRVRGMGENLSLVMAREVQRVLGISMNDMVGEITEEKLLQVEEMLKDPAKHGVRTHLLNHRKERVEGKDKQMLMSDLIFAVRQDVESEKINRSYRGWRHSIGQRVRGQHSRSTGRTGMSVGVLKKMAGKGSAAPDAKK